MRWTIRPTGDTAMQHLEHLDPPPPSGGLENKEEEGFYNLNKTDMGQETIANMAFDIAIPGFLKCCKSMMKLVLWSPGGLSLN